MDLKEQLRNLLMGNGFEEALIAEIIASGRSKKVPPGEIVMGKGIENNEFPFVIEGLLRVVRVDAAGSELFLYYVSGGETCAQSITCCLDQRPTELKLVAEQASSLWLVPSNNVDAWIAKYPSFRLFVFRAYQQRFDEMLTAIDTIAFMKLDERLMSYLLDKQQIMGTYILPVTHEQIARDLNTSRVVVSRLLKQLEQQEKIELFRNRIEIL